MLLLSFCVIFSPTWRTGNKSDSSRSDGTAKTPDGVKWWPRRFQVAYKTKHLCVHFLNKTAKEIGRIPCVFVDEKGDGFNFRQKRPLVNKHEPARGNRAGGLNWRQLRQPIYASAEGVVQAEKEIAKSITTAWNNSLWQRPVTLESDQENGTSASFTANEKERENSTLPRPE